MEKKKIGFFEEKWRHFPYRNRKTYNWWKSLPPAELNVSIHLLALRAMNAGHQRVCGAWTVWTLNTNPNTHSSAQFSAFVGQISGADGNGRSNRKALHAHAEQKQTEQKIYIQQTSNWIRNGNWFPWDGVIHRTDNDGTENGNIFGWKRREPKHGRRIAHHDRL